jgi:hypothetical protein
MMEQIPIEASSSSSMISVQELLQTVSDALEQLSDIGLDNSAVERSHDEVLDCICTIESGQEIVSSSDDAATIKDDWIALENALVRVASQLKYRISQMTTEVKLNSNNNSPSGGGGGGGNQGEARLKKFPSRSNTLSFIWDHHVHHNSLMFYRVGGVTDYLKIITLDAQMLVHIFRFVCVLSIPSSFFICFIYLLWCLFAICVHTTRFQKFDNSMKTVKQNTRKIGPTYSSTW